MSLDFILLFTLPNFASPNDKVYREFPLLLIIESLNDSAKAEF